MYVVLAYLQELVENERESQYEVVIVELTRLYEAVGDVLPFKIFARLIIALKILVLFRMLKQGEKMVLPRLNTYFPRSGFVSPQHCKDSNMVDQLSSGQQQFRSFYLQLIASTGRRDEYLSVRYEQEYGCEFVARMKELMNQFVSAVNNLLPLSAIDKLLGSSVDEKLVAELTATNSAVFEMLLDAVHGRDMLTAQQIISLLRSIRKDASLSSSFPKVFSMLSASDDGNIVRGKRDLAADSVEADMSCKLPRVSDMDLFGSDVAGQQHLSGDGNGVHSSGDVEIVSPSRSAHPTSTSVHSTSAEMDTRAADSLKQNVESYPDVDMMDDVEPDGSSSAASSECLHYQPLSGRAAVVTEIRSSPVIHTDMLTRKKRDQLVTDETPKPSKCSSSDCLEIADSSMSHSDDVVCINSNENSELYHDLVTQSSAADVSFHSLSTVDLDSELSSTVEDYHPACSQVLPCTTAEQPSSDPQVRRRPMHVCSVLDESYVSDSDTQSLLAGSQSLLIVPSSYSFDQFDALCGTDADARHRLLLPPIERLLRPASVRRSCVVKLFRAKKLDIHASDGRVLKMYS